MAFGKRGRPPEDRPARQREIYMAVAPLILHVGARQLSMQQAARAAHLSIGGLYHYFPTKRDLVLHGICPEAIVRYCDEFHAEFGHLACADPRRYIDVGIEVIVQHVAFCRPAIYAALELGAVAFWEVIDTLLTSTLRELEENLQRVAPEVGAEELHRWGRAIQRSMLAALLDKGGTSDEFRDELRILVDGYLARADGRAPVHAEDLVGIGQGAGQ